MNARDANAGCEWRCAPVEPVRFAERDLDPRFRPQDDLDAYVNSRWREANPVPAEYGCWDCFTVLGELSLRRQAEIADTALHGGFGDMPEARIVADFWATGLDSSVAAAASGFEVLRRELALIDAITGADSLAAYLRDAHARGCDPLFTIEAKPDFADPATLIAYVVPRATGLPDRDDYSDAAAPALARRAAYATHVARMLELCGANAAGVTDTADAVIAVERELAAVLPSRTSLARDIAATHHPVTPDEADRIAPLFSWTTFLASAAAPVRRFSLAHPGFHAAVDHLLRTVPLRTWQAFLRFRAADAAAAFLDEDWRRAHHRWHGEMLRGRRSALPRWKQTLTAVNACVGEAMGRLYARQHSAPEACARVRTLIEGLRAALRARIGRLDWMGAATKAMALDKLSAMRAEVGHPDRWRDWSRLATTRGSLYANVTNARRFERAHALASAGTPTPAHAWSMTPQTVNARYDPQRNEIIVPAALLQPPLFSADADAAAIHGGIGAVLAHEMTHGFDDQGSRFDAGGRFAIWWTDEDRRRFDALAARLVECIGACTDRDGEHVDGRLTLGENIADFGGLAVASDAFERVLEAAGANGDAQRHRQRFFLAWATLWRQNLTANERRLRRRIDVHAPGNVRANAAAANLEAFAAAFDCASRDAMARKDGERIRIW